MDIVRVAFGTQPGDAPTDDPAFMVVAGGFARFSATPAGYAAFVDMWRETDIRDVLSAVHVPTAVLYKGADKGMGKQSAGGVPVRATARGPTPLHRRLSARLVDRGTKNRSSPQSSASSARSRPRKTGIRPCPRDGAFTDIVNSTQTATRLGDHAWKALVERHHATVRALLARYRGTELDLPQATDSSPPSTVRPARCAAPKQPFARCATRVSTSARPGLHTGKLR